MSAALHVGCVRHQTFAPLQRLRFVFRVFSHLAVTVEQPAFRPVF
jgi:hypothetical protein